MRVMQKLDELNLGLESTIQKLPLWDVYIELDRPGGDLFKLFEMEPLLPGIILTKNQDYVGMISRRRFFQEMSRPYSLGLFSSRPVEIFYNLIKPEVFVLPGDALIVEATQMALQRSPELVYEPILVKNDSGNYGLVDFYQLLLAYSQIYVLTLTHLQQAQKESQVAKTGLLDLQKNYTRLVQNEKLASLGQLVAGVAHEINNPVNFIAGNLDHASCYFQDLLFLLSLYRQHYPEPIAEIQTAIAQIELDFLTTDLPKILASMKVGAERIREIVCSLRNFSRLDEAEKKAVDIHEGIDSTLVILQSRLQLHSKGETIKIIKKYGDLPLVECYPRQLNQVFMNILSNAIDALEDSGNSRMMDRLPCSSYQSPTIFIRTEMSDPTYLAITIADNGIGMSEEVRKRIFDPFFTTKPVGKGTGMGLPISYQIIVNQHNGQLYCTSAPGQGTEFVIKIPVV
ncbi:sensor histidine kinase [Fischerella thermalis]|uniref:sensor histidine kinase n=2 Tax=Fischerella thermalis TaxID=372787 RepID=UPI0003790B0A|nr:ATP-binding protein [Fischerella thermalis]PLZ66252.1 ATPase [Fischerella thermalis WC344]PLZ69501.1 ATPase [Fischerella thermalis WC249]